MNKKTLETSIYWQETVLRVSTHPVQKERARVAIEKLKEQLRKTTQHEAKNV